MSQSDFQRLKRIAENKYDLNYDERNRFGFTFDRVFGFLSFSINLEYRGNTLWYKIDMIPAIILVLGIVFVSMFITNSTIIISLIIGAVALVLIYTLSLLIVNGMVRRFIESYVTKKVAELEKKSQNPVCINCGAEMAPGVKTCPRCGYPEGKDEQSNASESGVNIKYSYKSNKKG
jgi:ribosomal protein L40E